MDAAAGEHRGHAGGLGVVEQDDVALVQLLREPLGVDARDALVDLALGRSERAAVAGASVQLVVDPLRQAEEVRLIRR